ncbi:hypothetical protein EDB87DRAFT_942729 [Lactarius vividus]|nr:hypothetical protein EDB87DRAFT_942729 [Lactarius vividus]
MSMSGQRCGWTRDSHLIPTYRHRHLQQDRPLMSEGVFESRSTILKYIVVFKKSASDEVINDQAMLVGLNGGTVDKMFSSPLLKGFSAEIPETYLLTLQRGIERCLQGGFTASDNQIDYIEPDPEVVTYAIPCEICE